ncbi:MAG TPA: DUF3182 family protein, partial [Pseudomonas sp.]|nr:DUF3182 family protein [Pseudomonas sp.]
MTSKSGVALLSTQDDLATHELAVHRILGHKIAALLGTSYLGDYTQEQHANCYLIPDETLVGEARYRALGIRDVTDFFGGAVKHPFMATKAITHPLLEQPLRVP